MTQEAQDLASPPVTTQSVVQGNAQAHASDTLDGGAVGTSDVPYLLPAKERLTYFRNQLLSHQILERMYGSLMNAINDPGDARLIFLYGPTRVGKTTLLDRIVRDFEAKRLREHAAGAWNPGHIPILRLAIPATGERAVSFRDIYWRMLQVAQEPLIEQKRAAEQAQVWRSGVGARRASEADLRWAVESMVRHRQPAAILLDEAQHLSQRRSATAVEAQLDCLKSLADLTGIAWVLVGSYQLIGYQNRNAQLSARSRHLHFPRYRLEQEADVAEFRKIVRSFGARLPFERPPDLERHWQLLYRYSGGIVGVVKTWLCEALKLAIAEGAETLTVQHLRRSAYEPSQVATMIEQAWKGETALAHAAKPDVLKHINEKTGMALLSRGSASSLATATPAPPISSLMSEGPPQCENDSGPTLNPASAATDELGSYLESASKPAQSVTKRKLPKNGRRRVGERKPIRDRIGLAPNESAGRRYRV